MPLTQVPPVSITDNQSLPTPGGQTIANAIDGNINTYWNPIGIPPGNAYNITVRIAAVSQISVIKIYLRNGNHVFSYIRIRNSSGQVVEEFGPPSFPSNYTRVSQGHWYYTAYLAANVNPSDTYSFEIGYGLGDIHLAELEFFTGSTWPVLVKRSGHGRGSFHFPGRQKPKWSSYQGTPSSPFDVV